MSKNLILPVSLLVAWFIFGFWLSRKYFCVDGSIGWPKTETAIVPATTVNVPAATPANSLLSIKDGTLFSTTSSKGIDFPASAFSFLSPFATDITASLQKTADYLVNNPKRSLNIIGAYTGEEENRSLYPNLGLARAHAIKKYLTDLGVPANQLLAKAAILTASNDLDHLENGVKFSFTGTTNDNMTRLVSIKERFAEQAITLYFPTDAPTINLTAAQQRDFADLVFYLDNVKGSTLEIGGHTDNKGDLLGNNRLSIKRAEFVQAYLVKNGLSREKMVTNGYGPNQPIASNVTSAGKAKNRRVEIRLK